MIKFIVAVSMICIWVLCGIIGAGFLNESMNNNYYITKNECQYKAAKDQSFSLGMGIVFGPITLGISVFATGFGYKGWSLARHKCEGL